MEFQVFLGYIISKLHLITARFHLVFSTSLSFYHTFVYRSSSWRRYMVVRQGPFSLFNCSSRFLKDKTCVDIMFILKYGAQYMSCFVLRSSSILHLAFRSAILSIISFEVVLCPS